MIVYLFSILFLITASFIKCFVDNNINKEFFYRRSRCDICKTQLTLKDLIPISSYLLLRGKCRYCNEKISITIFLYEFSALLLGIVYIITWDKVAFLNYLDYYIVLILLFIAIEDITTFEINEKLQIILITLCIINIFLKNNISNLKYTLLLIIMYHIIYFALRKGIGYGDIKLFSILALNLDFFAGIYLFLYTFILAGFFSIYLLLIKKIDRKSKIALAPYISLAYIIILINGELLLW